MISRDERSRAAAADRPHRRAVLRPRRRAAGARAGGEHRRHRSRHAGRRASRDIPAGDYFVQAFVNVYSEFKRADGHVLWMHDDQWEGQRWNRSPGNLYSAVAEGPHRSERRRRSSSSSPTKVIPPIEVPPDTEYVKRFKFQSPMLTKFWGRPIYLGATVLLPRDYERETISYPVNYVQGHFSHRARRTASTRQNEFSTGVAERRLPAHDRRHVPASDAVLRRLLRRELGERRPLRRRDHAGADPRDREALPRRSASRTRASSPADRPAAGKRSRCRSSIPTSSAAPGRTAPTPVTFTDVEGINIYEDENAFYKESTTGSASRPSTAARSTASCVRPRSSATTSSWSTARTADRDEQIDIWSAVFGPIGKDGYFEPLFDKRTGVINKRSRSTGRSTTTCSTTCRRTGRRSGRSSSTSCTSTPATWTPIYLNNSTQRARDSG